MPQKWIFALLILPFFSLKAQDKWGIKVGYNYSEALNLRSPASAPDLLGTQFIGGFHAGGFLNMIASQKSAYQIEILYNQKGSGLIFPVSSGETRFHYLSIPLSYNYQVIPKFNLQAGLEFSYLLASSDQDGFNIRILNTDRRIDVGLLGGFHINITKDIAIGARYIFGILPLSEIEVFDQVATPEATYKWHNHLIQVSLFATIQNIVLKEK